ncbi:hypothetical protein BDW62DRAFT_174487 [Aspergillus aurantiobrunneus]
MEINDTVVLRPDSCHPSANANKHVKCEESRLSPGAGRAVCKQCRKDHVPCSQTRAPIRFSDLSGKIAKRHDAGGSAAQFLKSRTPKKLVYVDETPELKALYDQDEDEGMDEHSAAAVVGSRHDRSLGVPTLDNAPPAPWTLSDAGIRLGTTWEELSPADPSHVYPIGSLPSNSFVMRGLVKPPARDSLSLNHNTLEFGLLGYYIDHLSTWLDLCDPERHFQLVVPHRARRCPPLMNAILAASARHLTRIPKYRTESGAVQYGGRVLHDLTDETALHYHNKCIHDLLELGATPEQTRNEDLLAAAIILRFYEEVDYPLQDEQRDDELFLRVLNMFIEAQIPNVPLGQMAPAVTSEISTSPAEVYNSPSASTVASVLPLESRWYMSSLRQAAFWVAFRQEVYSAFLKQRPFNMSLSRCDVFRSSTPGEDALWTARLVIFCADVLEFSYGNTAHPPPQDTSPRERWTQLKALSEKWVDLLPSSFEPIYFRQADIQKGEVFPEICYLTNIHVAGVQHIELARILLAVYDPNIPKLGLGHRESMRVLSEQLRAAVLRLCGIAVHNRQNPPSLTTALLGIVVCGEHFENRVEQRGLSALLDELEYHHGWPVGSYRVRLKQSWGWHSLSTS